MDELNYDSIVLKNFLTSLLAQTPPAASTTIKNYRADINQFILWFEKSFEKKFSPTLIDDQIISLYIKNRSRSNNNDQNITGISESSLKRHLSSLRQFFNFLEKQGSLKKNPLSSQSSTEPPDYIQEFQTYLLKEKAALLTIKNYLLDIKQFMYWLQEKNPNISESDFTDQHISMYQQFLFEEKKLSLESINRKISALKKFTHFLQLCHQLKIADDPQPSPIYNSIPILTSLESQPPKKGFFFLLDKLFEAIIISPIDFLLKEGEYILWKANKKEIFRKISPINPANPHSSRGKLLSMPQALSPIRKNKVDHKTTLPYQKSFVLGYFYFSILCLFLLAIGFGAQKAFFKDIKDNHQQAIADETIAHPLLTFIGNIKDNQDALITTPKQARFLLYSDPTASGSAKLWEEVDTIHPDQQGNFSVTLGQGSNTPVCAKDEQATSSCPIPSNIFQTNQSLYLGVSIENSSELVPRQQIPTTSLAYNAQNLQGLSVITKSTDTQNVVLALDSAGNLSIGGHANPVFQATGGSLTLSGQSLVLTTLADQDVQIAPNGLGLVDIQKPIHNSTNNNNLPGAIGSVEVDDTFAILATSSAQSAFLINQNGQGPIISASSGGIAKFSLGSDGSGFFAGNVGIGNPNPMYALQVAGTIAPDNSGMYDLGSPISRWRNLYADNFISTGNIAGFWQKDGQTIFPQTLADDLLIGGTASSSAKIRFYGSGANAGSASMSANLSFDGSNTMHQIKILDNGSLNIQTTTSGENALTSKFYINSDGKIGIGTTLPASALHIANGALCVGTNTGNCQNNTPGTIYANDLKIEQADYAENYVSSQQLQPGDAVTPALDGNNQAVVKASSDDTAKVIGVVSTAPGVTINGDAKTDQSHPYLYPIALLGRVPITVSADNGSIHAGDMLSLNSQGVAVKAITAGIVIGKALADFTSSQNGKVIAFIQPTWYDPSTTLLANGNLTITKSVDANTPEQYTIYSSLGRIIQTTGIFAKSLIADLQAGVITAQEIHSPIAEIDQIHTNVISPLSQDGDLSMRLGSNSSSLQVQDNTGKTITTIDSSGKASFANGIETNNATFSGQLNTYDASVAGTLRVHRIIADSIEGSSIQAATVSAEDFGLAKKDTDLSMLSSSILSGGLQTQYANIATFSAKLASIDNLYVTYGQFSQGLIAAGPSSFGDVAINDQLTIGKSLTFNNNGINVIGANIELQPLRQGGVDIAGGLFIIDQNGNVSVGGNADFAKDVHINGTLSTDTIKPMMTDTLSLQLPSATGSGQFVIKNSSDSGVLSINQMGDLISSGSAQIGKNIEAQNAIFGKLNFSLVSPAYALSNTEVIATGSAGTATINALQDELTIDNPIVTEKSLIYITPVGSTNNQVLYLLRQNPGTSFTVGISQVIDKNIPFNWIIIN